MSSILSGLKSLVVALIASIMLIILAVVYFALTLFVVRIGSELVDYSIDGNWAVLTAGLITLGVILGSSMERKS